jgi:hypothetical protein
MTQEQDTDPHATTWLRLFALGFGGILMGLLWGGLALMLTETLVRTFVDVSSPMLSLSLPYTTTDNVAADVHDGHAHVLSLWVGAALLFFGTVVQAFLLWKRV